MPPPIADVSFTEVASGGANPFADIVIVHGLQGHPEKTWYSPKSKKFWPRDRLAKSFPRARILVYGYDSKVSHFFGGAANQNSFLDHARNLLLDLRGIRGDSPTRPLLFICHSLGGILVKDVLRRCEPGRERHDFDLQEHIFRSTIGIIFMGTPHRGGSYGSLGKIAERVVRYLGFDTNDSILCDLRSKSTSFEIIHEEFLRILKKRAPLLPIYSFQEEDGLAGVQGLNGKVVDDDSSKLGYCYETVATLPGNHREMCRFDVYEWCLNTGYDRLVQAVNTYINNIKVSSRLGGGPSQGEPVVQLPFGRDPHFIGRDNELKQMQSFLTDEFSECAVVGLGGVGKTQVAVEFAYRLLEKERTTLENNARHSIFWLHASSAPRLEQGLKDIAKTRAFSTADLLPAIRDWFCGEQSGRWLLIIDNADDEDVFFGDLFQSKIESTRWRLCDFLPKKQGCGILYTSRNKTCALRLTSRSSPARPIMINPMEAEAAVRLIENGLGGTLNSEYLESIREYTERLVETLDRLPLALVQATAMMRENDQEIRDPKAYLKLYNEMEADQRRFLEEPFVDWRRDSGMPNSVFLSWRLSFDQLKKRDENTVRLLSLMSILDRQSIPEWLLAFYPEVSRFDRVKSLGFLHSFTFITPRQDSSKSTKWQMHRLVQIATHAYVGRDGLEQVLRKGLKLLAEAFMGHLYAIQDRRLWLKRSLEYYPHAKNVLYVLQSMGLLPRPEGNIFGGIGRCARVSGFEPATSPVEQTLEDLARQFRSNRKENIWMESRDNIFEAFIMISKGNFDSLEDIVSFVDHLHNRSGMMFYYYGMRPLVSKPIYGEIGSRDGDREVEDSDAFEEVDLKVPAWHVVKDWAAWRSNSDSC